MSLCNNCVPPVTSLYRAVSGYCDSCTTVFLKRAFRAIYYPSHTQSALITSLDENTVASMPLSTSYDTLYGKELINGQYVVHVRYDHAVADPQLSLRAQMRVFLENNSSLPLLYFYISCSLVFTSARARTPYSSMTMYKPSLKKMKDPRKQDKQACLAILLTKCSTPELHYLMLVIETNQLLWITDDTNYLSSFERSVESKDLVDFGLQRARSIVSEFLIIHGLVFNPEEGDSYDNKSRLAFEAARAMFLNQSAGLRVVTDTQLAGLKDGSMALCEGLTKLPYHRLLGVLKESRQAVLSSDRKAQVKGYYSETIYEGYCFSDAAVGDVTIYFLLDVSFLCALLFFPTLTHSTTYLYHRKIRC